MGTGCLRGRSNQRNRIHVGSSKSGGLGDAAPHFSVGPLSTPNHVCPSADLCFDCGYDRGQPVRSHPKQYETIACLLLYRSRRVHVIGTGGSGFRDVSRTGVLRWLERYSLVPVGLHLYEFGSICSHRFTAAKGRDWRRTRRYRRSIFPRAHRSRAHAHFSALVGRDPASGRFLRKIFYFSQSDRKRSLRAGVVGRALRCVWSLLLHAYR